MRERLRRGARRGRWCRGRRRWCRRRPSHRRGRWCRGRRRLRALRRIAALLQARTSDRDHHRKDERHGLFDRLAARRSDAHLTFAQGSAGCILQPQFDDESSAHRPNSTLHEQLRRRLRGRLAKARLRGGYDHFARRTPCRSRPDEIEGRAVRRRGPRRDDEPDGEPDGARQRPSTRARGAQPQERFDISTHDGTRRHSRTARVPSDESLTQRTRPPPLLSRCVSGPSRSFLDRANGEQEAQSPPGGQDRSDRE